MEALSLPIFTFIPEQQTFTVFCFPREGHYVISHWVPAWVAMEIEPCQYAQLLNGFTLFSISFNSQSFFNSPILKDYFYPIIR